VPEPIPAVPSTDPSPIPVPEPTSPIDQSPSDTPLTPPVITPPPDSSAPQVRLSTQFSCIQDPSLPKSDCFGSDLPADFSPILDSSEAAGQFSAFLHCALTCNSICAMGQSSGKDCKDRCAFTFCFPSSAPSSSLQFPLVLSLAIALAACLGYIRLKPEKSQGQRECREHLLTK
jgi:hypothetical protein